MEVSHLILYIMLFFMVLGGIDKATGSKLGLGQKFDEGFSAMGPLTLTMTGGICAAPLLGGILAPYVTPVYEFFGANPAMFATTFISSSAGGYKLAEVLAGGDEAAKNFAGLILGNTLGATVIFTIPVGLSLINTEDRPFFAKGILIGLTTIPIGCFIGGLTAGYAPLWMIKNLIPSIIIASVVGVGLYKIPDTMISLLLIFARIILFLLTIVLIYAGIIFFTGDLIPAEFTKGLVPIQESFIMVGSIAVVLSGAFVLVQIVNILFSKKLDKIGNNLNINNFSVLGLIALTANNLAMFNIMSKMDKRGKIMNVAFAVNASFVFGDHLGFVAGINKDMLFAVTIAKLAGGFAALALAGFIIRKDKTLLN